MFRLTAQQIAIILKKREWEAILEKLYGPKK